MTTTSVFLLSGLDKKEQQGRNYPVCAKLPIEGFQMPHKVEHKQLEAAINLDFESLLLLQS